MNQFLLFLLSGGMAAAINWGSRFIFSMWLPFTWAVTAAFALGLVCGFVMMRVIVFDGRAKPIAPQVAKYLLINLLALAQTLVISVLSARWLLSVLGLRDAEALGHLVGVLVPVITSYFGHRLLTFK